MGYTTKHDQVPAVVLLQVMMNGSYSWSPFFFLSPPLQHEFTTAGNKGVRIPSDSGYSATFTMLPPWRRHLLFRKKYLDHFWIDCLELCHRYLRYLEYQEVKAFPDLGNISSSTSSYTLSNYSLIFFSIFLSFSLYIVTCEGVQSYPSVLLFLLPSSSPPLSSELNTPTAHPTPPRYRTNVTL